MTDILGSGPSSNRFGIKPNTLSQYLAAKQAAKAQPSESFATRVENAGHSLLSDIGHPVSWAFDKLLRPMYATENFINTADIQHKGIGAGLHMAKEGFLGRAPISGSQLLSNAGLLKNHGILKGIAGLGIDIAADPLTYVTGGTDALATSAEHAALLKASHVALNTDLSALKGAEAAEAVDGMQLAADQLKQAGKGYTARAALAGSKADALARLSKGAKLSDSASSQLAALGQAGLKEYHSVEKFLPKWGIRMPFTHAEAQITPTTILGRQVVPSLPKLSNIASRPGIIGSLAKHWQDAFIHPNGDTAASNQLAISERHIAMNRAAEMLTQHGQYLTNKVPDLAHMSEDQMLNALHYFEVPVKGWKAVVQKGNSYVLNPAYINKLVKDGKLTPQDEAFVRAYHQVGQDMAKTDAKWGVQYDNMGKRGRIYVPHQFKLDQSGTDMPTFTQINHLTDAGFQKRAATANMSLKQIKKALLDGHYPEMSQIETNPLNAMAIRTMNGARKQSAQAITDALLQHLGQPERLVDQARLDRITARRAALNEQLASRQDLHSALMSQAHQAEQQFLADHERAFTDAAAEQEAKIRKIKYGKSTRAKLMNLRNATAKLERMQAQHAGETTQIAKGSFAPLNEHIAPHIEAAQVHAKEIQRLNGELKKLSQAEKKVLKGRPNAAYKQMSPIQGAYNEHGHNLALPQDIAHAVGRFKQLVNNQDSAINNLMVGYRKLLANWKAAVTSVNPGYRVRYSFANYVAMWAKGMSAHEIGTYSLKAANIIKKAADGDPAARRVLQEAGDRGALFGIFKGDVNTAGASLAHKGDTARTLLAQGRPLSAAIKGTQNFTIYFDNLDHLSFYLWNKAKGLTADEAARQTKEALFDYTHLTPFEQKTMKSIAPFYTWMRKNIPFQLKQFAENPGRLALYPKAAIESEQAAGGDKGNIIPSYIADNLAFQVPFGKHNYYTTSAGITDLRMFEGKGGAEEKLIGSLNPIFKVPAELITNKNTFTGQPINDPATHAYAPVSSTGQDILKLLNAFHVPYTNYGQTARMGPGGKRVTGPGGNPYAAYLMGQIPWGNYLLLTRNGIKAQQRGGVPPEMSQIAGISLTHVDPKTQQTIASINLQNQVKAEIAKLRDQGIIPPAKKPNSKKQNLIDSVLFRNLGKG